MMGFVTNIEKDSEQNTYFRKVLYTAKHCQLVVMSIPQGGDIGEEAHELDQFVRVEAGVGRAVLNGVSYELKDGSAVVVPAGTRHNIINTSEKESLKLYTLYSPPNHKDGTIHETRADAEMDEEHFDGITTETQD